MNMIHIVSFAAKKIKGGQTYCSHFLRFLRGDPILLNGEPCIGNAQECPVLPADSKWQSIHPPNDRPSRVEFLVGVVFRRWSRIVYKRRISKDNGERETAGERERERERDPGEDTTPPSKDFPQERARCLLSIYLLSCVDF